MLATVCVSKARADVYQITLGGTLQSGVDLDDIFGTGLSDLSGAAFTEVFYVDTTKGAYSSQLQTYPPSEMTSYSSRIFGYGGQYPVLASLTINGHTIQNDGTAASTISLNGFSNHSGLGELAIQSDGEGVLDGKHYDFSLGAEGIVSTSAATPFDVNTDPLVTAMGLAVTASSFTVGGANGQATFFPPDADETVTVTEVTGGPSVVVSAAPEPAVWALMLAGLGGIGLMLRRARRGAVLAA